MVSASTPWTVRTSKQKYPTSTHNLHRRYRNLHDAEDGRTSVRRKPRQQTLTQIQFVPHRSQDDRALDLEPIATVPRIAQARKMIDRLQKRNSTLTQMAFLTSSAIHDEQEDDLTLFQDAGSDSVGNAEDIEGLLMHLDGSQDTPNRRRRKDTRSTGKATLKRKRTPVVSQEFKPTQKKRKTDNERAADAVEHGRRRSSRIASANAPRSIGLASTPHERDQVDSIDSRSPRTNAAVPRAKTPMSLLQESSWTFVDQENQPLSQHKASRTFVSRTPSKCKQFVPSSQSPESLPPSIRSTTGPCVVSHIQAHNRLPLKERSVNAQQGQRRTLCQKSSPNRIQGLSPPKRKICVLKIPILKLQQEQAPDENGKALSNHSIWNPLSPSPRAEESEKLLVIPIHGLEDKTKDSKSNEHAATPSQAPTPEIAHSMEEDEFEMPKTRQAGRQQVPMSSPETAKTQETLPSLRGLLGSRDAPAGAMPLQGIHQPNEARHFGIGVKNFTIDNDQRWPPFRKTVAEHGEPSSIEGPGVAFVADSDEESAITLSPGSSIANDTQFNAGLIQRLPTSTAGASPSLLATPSQRRPLLRSLQLGHEIELSLPHPDLVHQPSTYSATKIVPPNDMPSSPSLPSRSTQRTVYPASLPRPSQVSTQDPTQSYLLMSSMPLAHLSSPTRPGPATVTIKDSSSVPRPLCDIPSQRYSRSVSQSQLNIDLGLDDCLDAGDEGDEIDDGLTALSDKLRRAVSEQESQVVPPLPPPLQTSGSHDEGETRFKVTEQGSPVKRRRRPRKPVIPPEVRAVLGETFLESVPEPPGWSQRSWDDEPL